MTSADDVLRACWLEIAGAGYEATAELLVVRHAEPHRRYHTAEHVRWVLHHVAAIVDHEEVQHDVSALRAAALFHDIVYDSASTTNEADSADIAATALTEIGWIEARVTDVRQLVMATAGHEPHSPAAAVLLDADLAVLGAEPELYRDYVAGVRAEHGFVDDIAWRSGRSSVLRSFLERDRIYTTPWMATREPQARRNLSGELEALLSGGSR